MQKLILNTVHRMHQRTYVRQYEFKPIISSTWRWMGSSLDELAKRCRHNPIAIGQANSLDRGINLISSVGAWEAVVTKPLDYLTATDLFLVFEALELHLEESGASHFVCVQVSRAVRTFVIDHIEASGQAALANRVRNNFRSSLKPYRQKGREMISDLPKVGRAPIGATAFKSYAELKEETLKVIRNDLTEIQISCEEMLYRYEQSLLFLRELENSRISKSDVSQTINRLSQARNRKKAPEGWNQEELHTYLAMVKQGRDTRDRSDDSKRKKVWTHPVGAKELLLSGLRGLANGAHIKDLLRLDVAPPSDVLLACALILQIHTHWNFISVLELGADDVLVKKFPHRLQSVKPRTSDQTPVVFVEKSDELVVRAMTHLRNRWERLVSAGILDKQNGNLWTSAWFLKGGEPHPIVSWATELREFTKAHNLPPFSLEQVRVQCLALVAMTRRGLGGATQAAGHIASGTTLRYIDKNLLRRLNSSNLLEYERRLENTIRYEMGKPETGRRIYLSMGDGTQCIDPQSPPQPGWMTAGICDGERCHEGDGCPNRRISINRSRIEEVVRTKNYYVVNWKRLADENITRFERVHLPQMLFNIALYGVLRKGPFRHLVTEPEL